MIEFNFTDEELDALKYYKERNYEAINQMLVSDAETDIALLSSEVENKVVSIAYDRIAIIEYLKNIKLVYSLMLKSYYEKKAKKELDIILGNQLLNAIKMINYEKKQEKILARNLLQEMFRFLSILNESNEAKLNLYTNYKGEMSKQAKKDFIHNKANASSINWEQ